MENLKLDHALRVSDSDGPMCRRVSVYCEMGHAMCEIQALSSKVKVEDPKAGSNILASSTDLFLVICFCLFIRLRTPPKIQTLQGEGPGFHHSLGPGVVGPGQSLMSSFSGDLTGRVSDQIGDTRTDPDGETCRMLLMVLCRLLKHVLRATQCNSRSFPQDGSREICDMCHVPHVPTPIPFATS